MPSKASQVIPSLYIPSSSSGQGTTAVHRLDLEAHPQAAHHSCSENDGHHAWKTVPYSDSAFSRCP